MSEHFIEWDPPPPEKSELQKAIDAGDLDLADLGVEVPSQHDFHNTRKRTKGERERDYAIIARLYLEGKTHQEIAEYISDRPDTSYTLTRQAITKELKKLRETWLTTSLVNVNEKRAEELAKIDRLEREYWDAWEASQAESDDGDPRYLQGVQWCISRRIKIFGLDAPKRTESDVRVAQVSMDVNLEGLSVDELNQLETLLAKALPGEGAGQKGATQPDRVHPEDVLEVPGRASASPDR